MYIQQTFIPELIQDTQKRITFVSTIKNKLNGLDISKRQEIFKEYNIKNIDDITQMSATNVKKLVALAIALNISITENYDDTQQPTTLEQKKDAESDEYDSIRNETRNRMTQLFKNKDKKNI